MEQGGPLVLPPTFVADVLMVVGNVERHRGPKMAAAPNSALLTDTYASPLRARHGAPKRER
jgi:hypothetical protein